MNNKSDFQTPCPKAADTSDESLRKLEAESIEIIRESVAEAGNPVMLYSAGKDSSVLLKLAQKAFAPGPVPFPLLHIDTSWKFQEMISFRNRTAQDLGLKIIVHSNAKGIEEGINPFDHGKSYTDIMKTQALKDALDSFGFDMIIGGARRDEEASRAKERIFSIRGAGHTWNPRKQRPEFWNVFNLRLDKDQSMRVFPLSNWTELEVWQYIQLHQVPIVGLYFAQVRPVIWRNERWIMADDNRIPLKTGETIEYRKVRFRTLGCYPLTAAIESEASTISSVIREVSLTTNSERGCRLIDQDGPSSMERKKLEGYF